MDYRPVMTYKSDYDPKTAQWTAHENKKGKFHAWGLDTDSETSWSVAIIEFSNGVIELFPPNLIRFLDT